MQQFEVIILGAGASGTICALTTKAKRVALVDCGTKVAKKLLATGNGRCNLTNTDIDGTQKHYNQNIQSYLKKFDVKNTLDFFATLGLEYYADEQKRVYPISNVARSVTDVLENALAKTGVHVFLEHKILSVEKQQNQFLISTDKQTFLCQKLVFALGSNQTQILNQLNILHKPFVPSLCALKTQSTKLLFGLRLDNVLATATCNGKTMSAQGEVLFKEAGLSGIVMFDLSAFFARNACFDGTVSIDVFPQLTMQQLVEKLKARKALNVSVSKFFEGFLANGLAYEVFARCKTNENRLASQLTEKEILLFAHTLKNLTFKVVGNYDNNQVFSGGVKLDDLDQNLQSKFVENLYFCGEVCNVDGLCGGYNLQWAWTSGHIVGQAL
jgi:predicted Rossmann fold flavoprotein